MCWVIWLVFKCIYSSRVFRVCWILCHSVTVWFDADLDPEANSAHCLLLKKHIWSIVQQNMQSLSAFRFCALCVCYAERKLWSIFIFTRWQFEPSVSESFWGHGKWRVVFSFVVSLMSHETHAVYSTQYFPVIFLFECHHRRVFECFGEIPQQDALQPVINS